MVFEPDGMIFVDERFIENTKVLAFGCGANSKPTLRQ
jgi:hypothetical protein